MKATAVTLGVQSGDVPSSEATRPHFLPLRSLLARHCAGPYSDEVDEFAIVLRVAGEIWDFDGEGCQKLTLRRKERYITIDIVIPRHRWFDISPSKIRNYLAESVIEACSTMLTKLEEARIKVDSDRLRFDIRKAVREFLQDDLP